MLRFMVLRQRGEGPGGGGGGLVREKKEEYICIGIHGSI